MLLYRYNYPVIILLIGRMMRTKRLEWFLWITTNFKVKFFPFRNFLNIISFIFKLVSVVLKKYKRSRIRISFLCEGFFLDL